jgi:anti-anti-sigma factor
VVPGTGAPAAHGVLWDRVDTTAKRVTSSRPSRLEQLGRTVRFLETSTFSCSMTSASGDSVATPVSLTVKGGVIAASGELDLVSSASLTEVIVDVARSSPNRVVVDLTDVRFMDSSALDAIETAHVRVPDCQIVLGNPSPWIRKLLSLTAMERICTF